MFLLTYFYCCLKSRPCIDLKFDHVLNLLFTSNLKNIAMAVEHFDSGQLQLHTYKEICSNVASILEMPIAIDYQLAVCFNVMATVGLYFWQLGSQLAIYYNWLASAPRHELIELPYSQLCKHFNLYDLTSCGQDILKYKIV